MKASSSTDPFIGRKINKSGKILYETATIENRQDKI